MSQEEGPEQIEGVQAEHPTPAPRPCARVLDGLGPQEGCRATPASSSGCVRKGKKRTLRVRDTAHLAWPLKQWP